MIDWEQEIAEGVRPARLAVELGKDDAVAFTRGGYGLAHLAGDADGGIALIHEVLILTPSPAAWFLGGFLRTLSGDPDAAINFLHVRCDCFLWTRRCSECTRAWRLRICLPGVSTWPRHRPSNLSGNCRPFSFRGHHRRPSCAPRSNGAGVDCVGWVCRKSRDRGNHRMPYEQCRYARRCHRAGVKKIIGNRCRAVDRNEKLN
jgi:hypothetical protein